MEGSIGSIPLSRRLWFVELGSESIVVHHGVYPPIGSLSQGVPVVLRRCAVQWDPTEIFRLYK
jgi:hypothetical protein